MSFLNPALFDVGTVLNNVQTHSESLLSFDVQIGSLKFPETPASNIPECFSLLRQACAIHDDVRTLNITPQSYATQNFVLAVPLSVSPGSSFSGLNTRSGDLLTIRVKGLNPDNTVNGVGGGRCFVTMLADSVCELREGSCSVLD